MPLLASAIERREPRGIGREGGKGLAPLERPFGRLDHLQSVSIALAEVSTDGNEYVQMEGYGFYRRNIAPTVTGMEQLPRCSKFPHGATEYVADVRATAHLAGATVLGPGLAAADQLTMPCPTWLMWHQPQGQSQRPRWSQASTYGACQPMTQQLP